MTWDQIETKWTEMACRAQGVRKPRSSMGAMTPRIDMVEMDAGSLPRGTPVAPPADAAAEAPAVK
ncbi:hypothetical protein RNZ50_13465 [Paracoccaceae bacterium Fryx2]|nr:hypothetical protein [Paracoccaceae bacterium Fryx2]